VFSGESFEFSDRKRAGGNARDLLLRAWGKREKKSAAPKNALCPFILEKEAMMCPLFNWHLSYAVREKEKE